MRRGIWYNVIIIKHILVNYQSRNGKESRMKKMLMALALCASMMLPGQEKPPEGMDTLSFPLITLGCVFPANYDGETEEERAKREAEEEAEQKEWDRETEQKWKSRFSEKGLELTWPEGSSIVSRREGLTVYLRVTNTPDNLVKVVKYFRERENEESLHLLECDVRIVGAGREALKAVGFEGAGHVSDAAALCKKLLDRDDVDLIDASRVIVRSGDEYVTKAVTEYIYPTEYNLRIESPISTNSQSSASASSLHSQNCALSAVEPTMFTMREVGSIVNMTPTLTYDCRLVDIELNVQFVSDPIWKDYGVKAPPATPSRYDLPMEQPFFPVRSVDVKTTVKPGRTAVFVGGGLSQKESGNKTLLVFVTVNGITADIQ